MTFTRLTVSPLVDLSKYLFQHWTIEFNCWWLVCDFYKDKFKISLPHYGWQGSVSEQIKEINGRLESGFSGWAEITTPLDGCLVAMGRGGYVFHVGVWLASQDSVLHIAEKSNGRIETLEALATRHNLFKFYRYDPANHQCQRPVSTKRS